MLIGSRILIPLDKNSVTFGKQKTGYWLALKILVECQGLPGKRIANARLARRAHEHARRLRGSNYSRREERIEMAQGPNVATNLANVGHACASGISLISAVGIGILSVGSIPRPNFAGRE